VLTSCTKAILQGKEEVLFYEQEVAVSLILKAVGVLVGSVATVMVSTILIALTDAKWILFKFYLKLCPFATVGLSTGITASVSISAKLVLIVTMYVGRVGVLLLMSAQETPPSAIHYQRRHLWGVVMGER